MLASLAISTAAADDHDSESPSLLGALDVVTARNGSTRVVGWVSVPEANAPTVRIVIDGKPMPGFRPTIARYDAGRVTSQPDRAWGWDVRFDHEAQSSVCVSAIVGGAAVGISCWSPNKSAFLPALGGGPLFGSTGRLIRYSIEVEAATGVHPEDLARIVDTVLSDQRSWAAIGDARFKRVKPGRTDLRIILATPATTDRLCFPFLTGGRLSCNKGDDLIVFNINRWRDAVNHWTASLTEYRSYLINHEVGHSLDFRHVGCPGRGQLAPLMMQQTKSLGGCRPNGWPYPDRATCLGRAVTITALVGQLTVGTSGDDVIVGTAGRDDIRGGGGNDTICGLGGPDTIRGNSGNDRLSGGGGADRLWGGAGADSILGNGGADTIRGGLGRDACRGGRGVDRIRGCSAAF